MSRRSRRPRRHPSPAPALPADRRRADGRDALAPQLLYFVPYRIKSLTACFSTTYLCRSVQNSMMVEAQMQTNRATLIAAPISRAVAGDAGAAVIGLLSSETEGRAAAEQPKPPAVAAPARTLRERLARPVLIVFLTLLTVAGGTYYLLQEPYVATDDAFVRAAKESVNARVSGQVVEIAVHDNQRVRKGQLLFRLDPEPFQIAVDQAQARLGSARLQVEALKATYRQQQAELQSARETAGF